MPDDIKQLDSSLGCPSFTAATQDGTGCVAVIATYNEIENLPLLTKQIHDLFPAMQVLVIDDNSPDSTGGWAEEFSKDHSWLSLISRSGKLGLGSATIAGFRWAMARNFSKIFTMDADFSHAPDQIERLLKASLKRDLTSENSPVPAKRSSILGEAPTNASPPTTAAGPVVIGSRYIAGGKIEGWPLGRRIASRLINGFARFWLQLSSHDNSGAFRCYDHSLLRTIDLNHITNQGYGYLEEILYLARRAGGAVIEVPITFRDRTRGQSKISFWDAFSALLTLTRLGFRLRLTRSTATANSTKKSY